MLVRLGLFGSLNLLFIPLHAPTLFCLFGRSVGFTLSPHQDRPLFCCRLLNAPNNTTLVMLQKKGDSACSHFLLLPTIPRQPFLTALLHDEQAWEVFPANVQIVPAQIGRQMRMCALERLSMARASSRDNCRHAGRVRGKNFPFPRFNGFAALGL